MENSSPPSGTPERPAEQADLEHITQTLLQLADRVAAGEADTASRFEAMRGAFGELRSHLKQDQGGQPAPRDNQERRLIEFLGYRPTVEQQMPLFAALAEWQATEPRLTENRQAEYQTKKGGTISYGYADLAGVIATGQGAAAHGLAAITRQELDDFGDPVVTAYLVHSGGGAITSGPVPLFMGESDRRGQAHAAALTTARRLALQMVLGLAAERDDDFNASSETSPRQQATRASGGRTVATPQRRQGETTAPQARTVGGRAIPPPPPGWISKDDRRKFEQELMDPAITPERFAEIEAKLIAADQLAASRAQGGQAAEGPAS
jgi:hypothetical protein